jgi:glutathione S-transferase
MKIYNTSTAPNPRRVRVFLAEKGIQVPYEEVDIVKAVNRGLEFRKKNPLATVPVLELDDGTCISESVAICRYFEELHPNPIHSSASMRRTRRSWRCGTGVSNSPCFSQLQTRSGSATTSSRGVFDRFQSTLRHNVSTQKTASSGSMKSWPIVATSPVTSSIADITAMIAVDFGRVSKIAIKPEQKNLARWHAEVAARPSAKAYRRERWWSLAGPEWSSPLQQY